MRFEERGRWRHRPRFFARRWNRGRRAVIPAQAGM